MSRRTSALLQDAQHHLPADTDRASRRRQPTISAISALDATLLSDEAVPASKLTHRLGYDAQLDYGQYATRDYTSGHYQISVDLAKELMASRHQCRLCQKLIEYEVVGLGLASTFTAHCRNRNCVYDKIKKSDTALIGKYFYKTNLAHIYSTLNLDTGYVGYQEVAHAMGCKSISKSSYQNHFDFLYTVGEDFYKRNLPLVHADVKYFFSRCLHESPDFENGEFLDLIVSLDGSYSHIGHFSSGGVTFVADLYTGRVLDFEFTEKCFECKDVIILLPMAHVKMGGNSMVILVQWKPIMPLYL